MCGILGGNQINWDYIKGIDEMKHRGPDKTEVAEFDNFVLAFARLSIMDLTEDAMQPMYSLDKQVCIVFNGEIYGFDLLKKKLNCSFRTTSDTEVILNAYLEYGDNFINEIDGMFAIAIYDLRIGKIKLYRDRVGIKPLYYYNFGNKFAFASELKALTAICAGEKFEIDYTALYDYLFYRYIPEPKSIYKNVYKLPPAFRLIYDVETGTIKELKRYWKLRVNSAVGRNRKQSEIEEELKYLIEASVKDQLVADVPIGTYLSGGIDSSVITYECNKIHPNIRTFTIGFHEKQYDESSYADLLIEKYFINSNKKILSNKDITDVTGNMNFWFDEPFADTSAYPTYIVSQFASEEVTVVLTGDGSDELFGGYQRYDSFFQDTKCKIKRLQEVENLCDWFFNKGRVKANSKLNNCRSSLGVYSSIMGFKTKEVFKEIKKQWGIPADYDIYWYFRKYYNEDLPTFTRAHYLDFKTYLPSDILTKVDRTSMAVSLEARVPFLSKSLIKFAFSLSEEECCPNNQLKGVLKQAYRDVIPKDILLRKKRGFSAPPNYFYKDNKEISKSLGVLKKEWPDFINKVNF